MKLLFLGTVAGANTRDRNSSCLLLTLDSPMQNWLFDCGERSHYYLQQKRIKLNSISKIFITHMHSDHILGLMPLLCAMSVRKRKDDLLLFGPKGISDFIEMNLKAFYTELNFNLIIKEHESSQLIYEDDFFTISTHELLHRCPSFAFRIEQKDQFTRFNTERLKAENIDVGSWVKELKYGRNDNSLTSMVAMFT
ncbi:MAG: MBL fold metallo-hydrolase [Neisseriaceae bacterium]|nr:MBL fold metallo-hydrolase [Neisseriaceae bacterium]